MQFKLSSDVQSITPQLLEVLKGISHRGIKVDKTLLAEVLNIEQAKSKMLLEDIAYEAPGLKINSPKSLAEFFDASAVNPEAIKIIERSRTKSAKGNPSFDKETLTQLEQYMPIAGKIAKARSAGRAGSSISNILDGIDDSMIVHPDFSSSVTGRIFCKNPNLVNMPQPCRKAVVPRDGNVFIYSDYKSEEMLIVAQLSGQDDLIEMVGNGVDVFTMIAERATALEAAGSGVAISRDAAKVVVYGYSYGQGPEGLAASIGISIESAISIQHAFSLMFPKYVSYIEDYRKSVEATGFSTTALLQKKLSIINSIPPGRERDHEINKGVNFRVQGTGADIMELLLTDRETGLKMRELGANIVLPIFDAVLVECPKENAEAVRLLVHDWMTSIPRRYGFTQFVSPMIVSSWGEVKEDKVEIEE